MLVNIWLLNITSAALIIIFYKFYWRKCTKNKKDVKTVRLISTSKKLTKVSIFYSSQIKSRFKHSGRVVYFQVRALFSCRYLKIETELRADYWDPRPAD